MKTMMMRGSPVIRPLLAAAALVIVVFGLKYSSDVLAPIFLAATLAILFTPALWWLEKKGLHPWLALVVMVLALGGFIVLMIFILTTSLEQLSLHLPEYADLLHQRIDTLGAALGTIGVDLQETLNSMVVDTTEVAHSAIDIALGVLSNSVAIVFFLFLLFLMLVESRSVATKFQTRLQAGNILAIGIILNATMDNAVTPRIYGKGLNLPVLLVFTSFLFWSWVFGFVGALLAIPATLFVKALLQGRQETRFLVVLLSWKDEGNVGIVPDDQSGESNASEEQSGTNEDGHKPLIVDPSDTSPNEE